MQNFAFLPGRGALGLCLVTAVGPLLLGLLTARAAEPLTVPPVLSPPDLKRAPIIPTELVLTPLPTAPTGAAGPAPRIRLFRFEPGFMSDPPGLDLDDTRTAPAAEPVRPDPDGDGPEWITFAMGNDNPYFDFRRRSDPGGVGFTRVNTQFVLFDSATTSCTVGVRAVAPAGVQFDGLPDSRGATVVTPALGIYHALDETTAVHAFVGRHMPVINKATQSVSRDLQYGMAVQRPLWTEGPEAFRYLYLSVGALGQVRQTAESRGVGWEVMPGLHYRMADNWWISGGVAVPVGPTATQTERGQRWQVTCSLQF